MNLLYSILLVSGPGSGVGESVGAGSPVTDYMARLIIYVFISSSLVTLMLVGGFLILNLGMLSKRYQDVNLTTKRGTNEVGILKSTNWPVEAFEETILPPTDQEEQQEGDTFEPKAQPKETPPKKVA